MKRLKMMTSLVIIIFCMMLLCSCDGIRTVNGKMFYYQNNEMVTGWYKINSGEYYYCCEDEREIDNRKFEKGEMLNNTLAEINGVLYAFNNNGIMCKSTWINYGNNKMYAAYDGHIVKNETREVDGSRYEFDYKGVAKLIPDYSLTIVPSLPHTFYSRGGDVTIESIDYKFEDTTSLKHYVALQTYWSGICGGSLTSSTKTVGWKLYDPDGYVIQTGTFYTEEMKQGDKFREKNHRLYNGFDIKTTSDNFVKKGNYKLELLDTY